ncbi:MAG: AbrB family transcriptional regulator [Deltaproteobacteria bacterium]|jgi:membrane AbrB-like protein|nr:AbrB family transcriptional regulator [Deltaproteobacteria bacterium]
MKISNWLLLAGSSAVLTCVLGTIGCPAYAFLGPMISAVIIGLLGRGPNVPDWSFPLAKSVIGALVAKGFTSGFWAILAGSWPYLAAGTVWAVFLGALMSLALLKLQIIRKETAFWCLSPGGAAVMVMLADQHGGDVQVVAFAQYFRVLLISAAAILVSGLLMKADTGQGLPTTFFPPMLWRDLFMTLAGVLAGLGLAALFPFIPGGQLLLPMFMVGLSKYFFNHGVFLPPWLLYPCYALMAWRIGLSFTRDGLRVIARMIPGLFAGVMVMFLGCAFFGWFMSKSIDIEPLTAYLASCPGGLDAVTIIAASSGANLPFITAMQAMRLILVISFGPWFYSLLARRFSKGTGQKEG